MELIIAVKNSKSHKLFILIDENDERFRVINPEGAIVSLGRNIFEDDAIQVPESDFSEFSSLQINKYREHQKQLQKSHDLEVQAQQIQKQQQSKVVQYSESSRSSTQSRSSSSRRQAVDRSPSANRTGVAASWSGSSMTFYRPQIDRLGQRQSFKVEVHDVGTFVISKTDFQNVFADVVLSESYKKDGFFAYGAVPDKAMKFKV